jgi:hypothetical protein
MNRKLSLTPLAVMAALFALLSGVLAATAATMGSPGGPPSQSARPQSTSKGQSEGSAGPLVGVGTGFTYQGRLKEGSLFAGGQYDLQFSLFQAASGGSPIGVVVTKANQAITDGLFTVNLDFSPSGAIPFQGQERWLQIAVRPAGVGSYTTLSPRQLLSAVPYALSLMPGAVVTGTTGSSPIFAATNTSTGTGLYGSTVGDAPNAGVYGLSTGFNGAGVYGTTSAGGHGDGVYGYSFSGSGVHGFATEGSGVYGNTTGTLGTGVYGSSTSTNGVYGTSGGNASYAGVRGFSTGLNGRGVWGTTTSGINSAGVYGSSSIGYAGYFEGDVHVNGVLSKSAGSFKIDHPLDPANKYLYHSFVESPDMMDIYNGSVTTGANGEAVVTLPDWFDALNRDFRYQLTIVGDQFAQARVSSKIDNNRFTIATDKPNIEVSWQVTGIRHDAYAEAHRIPVEQVKRAEEKGTYLNPTEQGQPESQGLQYALEHQAQAEPNR